MNVEKRIKRRLIGRRHAFFAAAAPGFEELCRRELQALGQGLDVGRTLPGGIEFSGRLIDLYRANLHLRTASRILWRLAVFKATNFRLLARRIEDLEWSLLLPAGALPGCRAASHRSRLYHSGAVAGCVREAIAAHWLARGLQPAQAPEQTVIVRLDQDEATISLDSSGDNLYRRGLKRHHAAAPLRETAAAAILLKAGYMGGTPLLDPMCGAGTFSLEAAMIAKGMAPGLQRDFAFTCWPAFRPQQWNYLKSQALAAVHEPARPAIEASDRDAEACRQLSECLRDSRLDDAVRVACRDFFDLQPAGPPGLVVLNPPYGRRLDPGGNTRRFYKQVGAVLGARFRGWRLAILLPESDFTRFFPFPMSLEPLAHGGLTVWLAVGRI